MPVAARAALSVVILLIGACPDRETRRIAGDYCLDRWFDGQSYDITGCGWFPKLRGTTDNGPMEGTIEQLGWDRRYIVARRIPLFKVDGEGWMVLDTERETLSELYPNEAWARRRQAPDVANITTYPVKEAWDRLGHEDR